MHTKTIFVDVGLHNKGAAVHCNDSQIKASRFALFRRVNKGAAVDLGSSPLGIYRFGIRAVGNFKGAAFYGQIAATKNIERCGSSSTMHAAGHLARAGAAAVPDGKVTCGQVNNA